MGCCFCKCCKSCIYAVPEPWHLIILIANICFSGSGTMMQAFCKEEIEWCILFIAFLQLILTPFLGAGWIWSILHGYFVFTETSKRQLLHPMHYASLEEFNEASKVNLMDQIDEETLQVVQ